MSRPKEEARYGDLPPCWNYQPDQTEASPATSAYPPAQHPHMFAGDAFPRSYGMPGLEVPVDERYAESARINGFQKYALLDVSKSRLVEVMYDENRQRRLVIPVDNQYELFERAPPAAAVPPGAYSVPVDFATAKSAPEYPRPMQTHHVYPNVQEDTTSNFIKDVLGNWEPNVTGTYAPFGQHYPLNHPSTNAPENIPEDNSADEKLVSHQKNISPPRRTEQTPLADNSRKRIIAEVKPMRPSYSDVLSKNNNNKPTTQIEFAKKSSSQASLDAKSPVKNGPVKTVTSNSKQNDEDKLKSEKVKPNVKSSPSSGSDSGEFINEEPVKPNKRSKTRNGNTSGSWSSFSNATLEDDAVFTSNSDFFFVQNPVEKPPKKTKKEKTKMEKTVDTEEELFPDTIDGSPAHEGQSEVTRIKKKSKDKGASAAKAAKISEKKKSVSKMKRGKASGYMGIAQNYIERWSEVSVKALVWFYYLLSDIFHMSLHLSCDLLSSTCTRTYVSWQAVWRGGKDRLSRLKDSKYLQYIDNKLGDTPLGFWRKMKWFKKAKEQPEQSDGVKAGSNIPLPATGEEAMKRLLACKGKDPYSILGVKVSCTDDEIKRYYRRQAFLVHPDKNQQPGAEEAFKILQHAFELIGEPEKREAFDRRTIEERHAEAAWGELSTLLAQLHDKMAAAANTIRCTNCGRRHKRVITDRPCYAARYCAQCKIRHSAKEGDIWSESGMWGMVVMYYACMDGAVYQITQWASCQKNNLRQLKPNCHVVQYRIVLGNKATANLNARPSTGGGDPNLEEFLNNLYGSSRSPPGGAGGAPPDPADKPRRRNKKTKP